MLVCVFMKRVLLIVTTGKTAAQVNMDINLNRTETERQRNTQRQK